MKGYTYTVRYRDRPTEKGNKMTKQTQAAEKQQGKKEICKYFMQCGQRRKRGLCACKYCPSNKNR